jgi:hypothetical protein
MREIIARVRIFAGSGNGRLPYHNTRSTGARPLQSSRARHIQKLKRTPPV